MRAFIPDYQLITPARLDEALQLIANEPGVWRPFAGGTDLMVLLEAGKLAHNKYLNLWALQELRGITATDEKIVIGALTTYTEIRNHELLQSEFPMLCQAASETGGLAIQNRGTLGGNIANASPAADSPPALLAYDATLEIISLSGVRQLSYRYFHQSYKKMDLRPDELIARIHLPRNTQRGFQYYRKVGTRKAQAISKVCFAAIGYVNSDRAITDVRLALGSVAPIPLRCVETEAFLKGKKIDHETIAAGQNALAGEMSPISDIRSTRDYRLRVSLNLLHDFLAGLLSSASKEQS